MTGRKNIVFIGVLLLLFVPMIQQKGHWISVQALAGDVVSDKAPSFVLKNWFTGQFQQDFEQSLEERVGFRPWLVRFKNHLEYVVFRKANASGVLVGKKGYLFEYDYIRSYQGIDYLGEPFWEEKFRRLTLVRDTLEKLGVEIAMVLEPGKASYYPEFIPGKIKTRIADSTNYAALLRQSKRNEIPLLDLNALFVEKKSSAVFPHFPKGGIHWAYSAMLEGTDTLLRFADQLTPLEIPEMSIQDGEITTVLQDTDNDLVEIMNLAFTPKHPEMHYPRFEIAALADSLKPKVLAISDSFYFNILNAGIPGKAFANQAFWYYAKTIYPDNWSAHKDTSMINVQESVEQMDLILLMATERFYHRMAWNFIEMLYKTYYPNQIRDLMYDYKTRILTDYQWFDLVVKDAESRKIRVAEALRDHAAYQIWQDELQGVIKKDVSFFYMKIKKDSAWMAKLSEKAKENGISLEKQIDLDARWLAQQEKN